jgi:hypothetical protein
MPRKLCLTAPLVLGVCLLLFGSPGAFAVLIEKTDYVPSTDPSYVGYLDSLKTWWHDGGPPYDAVTPNDDFHVFFVAYNYIPEPGTLALVGARAV